MADGAGALPVFVFYSFLYLSAAAALPLFSGAFVDGCAMAGCTPRRSFSSGLYLPPSTPSTLWSYAFPPSSSSSFPSPGCVSQHSRVVCATPFSAGPVSGSLGGATSFNASLPASTFLFFSPSPSWCAQDASWGGVGSQLPILSVDGELAFWSPSAVSMLSVAGAPRWSQPISPPLPCVPRPDAVGAGATLSSVSLTNNSRLMFAVGTEALSFGYFGNGVPDAAIVFRANASEGLAALPFSYGLLLPVSPQVTAGARNLYVCRFYLCRTANACSGVAAGLRDPQPALSPTGELALVALDVLDAGTPARFVLPWANAGPALALPRDVAGCAPDFPTLRERVAVSATVLQDDATLVLSFMCLNASTGAAGGDLHVRAYGVDAPHAGAAGAGGLLWATTIATSGGWWGAPLPPSAAPPVAPPSAAHDATSGGGGGGGGGSGGPPGLLWIAAGGPLGDARLFAVDTASGALAANASLSSLVAAAGTGRCALAGAPQRLALASPLHAAPREGGGALLVAVEAAAGGSSWLLGVATAAAAGGDPTRAWLLWCAPLPARPAGQIALAEGPNGTSIVLVAGSMVVALG